MAKKRQKKRRVKKARSSRRVNNKMGQIQILFAQATRYHQTGQFVQAEQFYRKILTISPNHADSLHLLGLILADRGLLNEGLDLINKAINNNPRFAAFYLNRGLLYKRMQQPEKAMTDYIKAIQLAPQMVEAHYNLGDALTEAEQLDEAIVAYQTALKYAPQHRNTHNNLGNAYLAKEQYHQAIECYKKVLNLDAKCAETLSNLGVAYFKLQQHEEAIAWQKKAISCTPNYAQAYSNLGLVLNHLGKFIEAEECYYKALELQPNNAEFHSNLGVNYKDQNNVDTALECFKKSLELNPNSPEAQFNEAISLLLKGDFINGWQRYESRFGLKERVHTNPNFTEPVWQGENFFGTLLVYVEQGLGDTLQFVRYLPLVAKRVSTIIFECQQELVTFFELQKKQLSIDQIIPRGAPKPAFDCHIAIMSLPRIFQTTIESIPYAQGYLNPISKKIPELIVENLQQDSHYKVGLIWAGGKQHKNDHNRSIAFTNLQPLLELSAISFYSLQYGENSMDIKSLPNSIQPQDLTKYIRDFTDTAMFMEQLDLIISVDTAPAHLAGALGKPIWLLLPFAPDFRWLLERNDSPWYQSMQLFRQPKPGDWQTVIQQVACELKKKVIL
jgi:tetratricopeptide (TPR) repeat protein